MVQTLKWLHLSSNCFCERSSFNRPGHSVYAKFCSSVYSKSGPSSGGTGRLVIVEVWDWQTSKSWMPIFPLKWRSAGVMISAQRWDPFSLISSRFENNVIADGYIYTKNIVTWSIFDKKKRFSGTVIMSLGSCYSCLKFDCGDRFLL